MGVVKGFAEQNPSHNMKKENIVMKKIISIALMIAMLAMSVCAFASCEAVTAASAIKKADQALLDAPYTVTMAMNFKSDNAEVNEIFEAMNMEIPVTVDGENIAFNVSTESMGMTASFDMIIVDKVLYYELSLFGQTAKMKATLTDEQYKEINEESNTQMPISSANFETLTLETVDGKQVITCTGITTEGTEELNKMLADTLSSMDATASIGDLSFKITIADGKYETMALSVAYTITVAGETVTTTMTMNAKYAYDNVKPITAPADADSYEEMDYDQIIG